MNIKCSAGGALPFDRQVFPALLEDETLYSWCARYHQISGNALPQTTSKQLFRHPSAGLRHEIPGNLTYFVNATNESVGTFEELLYRRTHFRLFAPLLSEQRRGDVVNALALQDNASAQQRLGLSRTGSELISPLKSCPECLVEDRHQSPMAWWRLAHQWLPTRVCLRHGTSLYEISPEAGQSAMREWLLPVSRSVPLRLNVSQFDQLARIARWTEFWVMHDGLSLHEHWLRYAYLLKAQKRGWIGFDGALRFTAMRNCFANEYAGLVSIPGLGFLNEAQELNGGFLGLLLRKFDGQRHPIKHIYLIDFLFDDPEDFLDSCQQAATLIADVGIEGLQQRLKDKQLTLRKLVGEDGQSVNAAASEIGYSATTALRFLNRVGVDTVKRPRVMTDGLKEKLDTLLTGGVEHDAIALSLSIKKGLIREYLRTRPVLRKAWIDARHVRRLAEYRQHFLLVLKANPGLPTRRIRRIPMCGFEWLYRNDREWLEANLPRL